MYEKECSEKTYKAEILSRNEFRTTIELSDEKGNYMMAVYQVFPGIELIYSDAHIQSVQLYDRKTTSDNIFEISHCKEGRVECSVSGEFWYLSPGDLAIARTNRISSTSFFPLGNYKGITIRIDLENTPGCLSCLLDDVTVHPQEIADKFCKEPGGFVLRSNSSLEHIFSELYSVPSSIQKGYFKVKTLELLLFLSAIDTNNNELSCCSYTKSQVELAKKISRYLAEHMDTKITLDHLSEYFHVSGTHIKNIFKGVYGVSIGSYIRARKMESAAYMLEHTDKSILEIAGEHGYDNASKFAGAFRDIIGMAPNEYRNMNCSLNDSRV